MSKQTKIRNVNYTLLSYNTATNPIRFQIVAKTNTPHEAVPIFFHFVLIFSRSRPETTTNIETSTRPRPRPRPRQLGIGTETETSKTGFETGLEKYNTEH